MATTEQQERNREILSNAERAVAARQDAFEHPRRRLPTGNNRLLLAISLATFLVVGAVVSLALGSWWFLAIAVAVHGLATALVLGATGSLLAREEGKPSPTEVAARDAGSARTDTDLEPSRTER
jgi:hypothetical protein